MYSGVDKFGGKVVGDKATQDEGMDFEDSIALASIDETLVLKMDGAENIDNSNEKLISANVDPTTGFLIWTENGESSQKEIFHRVVSKSQMASMLHDKHRNEAYYEAIKQSISIVKKQINRDPVVLDIGAGTGLLSLMSASSGAEHVYGCEMFEPLCEIAKEVIDNNGLSEKITIIPKRSIDVEIGTDIPDKVDLIVTEIFDTVLLGEGVLPTIKHAREHLLKSKGKILPSSAKVFAQLIESPQLKEMVDIPSKMLTPKIAFARSEDAVPCRNNGIPLPVHASKLKYRELSDPVVVLEIDFENLSVADPLEGSTEIFLDKVKPGTCHGVLMWWTLQLSPDVILSTAPGTPWQDHWLQAVYPFSPEMPIDKKTIKLSVFHNDLMIWFDISTISKKEHSQKKSKVSVDVPTCFCGIHFLCNSERTWMMGDSDRNSKYFKVIQKSVSKIGEDSICLDISDGSICALLAAAAGSNKIYSIESRDFSEMFFQQIVDANELESKITLLENSNELSPEMFEDGAKIELLMSEPFYYQMQNWQLTQAISFWYRRNYMRELGLLSETCRIVPLSASVKCVAIELKDLQKSFGKVGRVCGFDHSFFDDVVLEGWAEHDYIFPLWMYDFREISQRSEIFKMDFTQSVNDIDANISIPLKEGICHAIAIWIDYSLDEETIISTAPEIGYWKTTLRFFPEWEKVNEKSIAVINAKLNKKEAKFKFQFEIKK